MFVGHVWFEVSSRQLRPGLRVAEGFVGKYRDGLILGPGRAYLAVSIRKDHVQMMINELCPRSQIELFLALLAVSNPCDLKPLDTMQWTNTVLARPGYANLGPGYANLRPG